MNAIDMLAHIESRRVVFSQPGSTTGGKSKRLHLLHRLWHIAEVHLPPPGCTTLSAVPPGRLPLYTVLQLQACYVEPDCPAFLRHITIL